MKHMFPQIDLGWQSFGHLLTNVFAICFVCGITLKYARAQERIVDSSVNSNVVGWQSNPGFVVELEDSIAAIQRDSEVPGLIAGCCFVDGKQIVIASGLRNAMKSAVFLPTDPVHLGSITKSMTATLIALAVQEGDLSWETTLEEVFPLEFDDAKTKHWADVTIESLLHHMSGASHITPWALLHIKAPNNARESRRELLRWQIQMERPPVTNGFCKYQYSNGGYAILGHVLETIYDLEWEKIIAERLFDPLDIQGYGFGVVEPNEEMPIPPVGHRKAGGQWSPIAKDNLPPLGPAGRVFMPLSEFPKYLSVHFRVQHDHSPFPNLGLSQENLKHLHRVVEESLVGDSEYACGWIPLKRKWSSGDILYHNGSNTYWYAVAFVALDEGMSFFAAANGFSKESQEACDASVVAMLQIAEQFRNE